MNNLEFGLSRSLKTRSKGGIGLNLHGILLAFNGTGKYMPG